MSLKLHMFHTDILSIISSLNTVYTAIGICHHEILRMDKITGVYTHIKKVKWPRYRPGVAQRVGRVIALLFHDRGTGRGWVVSSMPRLHFTPGKDPVLIVQGTGWVPGPVWTGWKSHPHRDSIPDRPARSSRYTDWATRPTYIHVYCS